VYEWDQNKRSPQECNAATVELHHDKIWSLTTIRPAQERRYYQQPQKNNRRKRRRWTPVEDARITAHGSPHGPQAE
jgi:hypothetical protein